MSSNPSSPVYPVRLITASTPIQQPPHREVIVPEGFQRLIEERLERVQSTRALDGDHGGVDRCDRGGCRGVARCRSNCATTLPRFEALQTTRNANGWR